MLLRWGKCAHRSLFTGAQLGIQDSKPIVEIRYADIGYHLGARLTVIFPVCKFGVMAIAKISGELS